MTCIAGYGNGTTTWIGGDSAGIAGLNLRVRSDKKVFKKGPMVFGFAGSFRMGQLLRYSLSIPARPEAVTDEEYLSVDFVNAVRGCLERGGFSRRKDNEEIGGTFMLGYKGRIWTIEDDFQVALHAHDFEAIGCGGQIAVGAMDVMLNNPREFSSDPKEIILEALKSAERMSAGVRGPFTIVESD